MYMHGITSSTRRRIIVDWTGRFGLKVFSRIQSASLAAGLALTLLFLPPVGPMAGAAGGIGGSRAISSGSIVGLGAKPADTPNAFYVSPTGSDSNPGTATAPFATLAHAQALVRTINQNMTSDITVYLESGTYALPASLQFTAADSGTNGYDVIWTAAPGATVVISGAQQISGWHLSDPSKHIWSATVPAGLLTRQIYVNGVRATPAAGSLRGTLIQTKVGYVVYPNEMSHWRNPKEIDFGYLANMGLWTDALCPVSSIKGDTIKMAEPCWNNSTRRQGDNFVGWGNIDKPSYIENAYELIGQPGEFYLDTKNHRLYYVPRHGEDMKTADVEAPRLQTLFGGEGTVAAPIHNIEFSNLQFSYATWLQPNTSQGFSEVQSNYTLTGKGAYATQGLCHYRHNGTCPYGAWTKEPGNVNFSYDQNLSFINDRFVHLGAAGLNLDNGSQNDTVAQSVFTDISGNGIEIGNVDMPQAKGSARTSGNEVIDNHLYGLPVEYQGGVPIIVGYAANTNILHNQVDHVPYSGIWVGWGGWPDKLGHPPVLSYSHGNVIADNLVFDFMQLLADGGGIYTQGIQGTSFANGERITGNVVHGELDWCRALQSDDGASYVTFADNALYNNAYDWGTSHYDYVANDGNNDPLVIHGNYWEQGDGNSSYKRVTVSDNHLISGPSQAPADIIQNAGIEPAFQSLLTWQPQGVAVPNPPQSLKILYAYKHRVDLTWRASFAEGNAPVTSYTVRTCREANSSPNGQCSSPVGQPLTISDAAFDALGYVVITGLKDWTSYTFTVTANSAVGSSALSVPSGFASPVSHMPPRPGKPAHVYVRAGNGLISLQWYGPASARAHYGQFAERPVLAFVVTRPTAPATTYAGLSQVITSNAGGRTVVMIGGLPPGTYKFSVAAVTPGGIGPKRTSHTITLHS